MALAKIVYGVGEPTWTAIFLVEQGGQIGGIAADECVGANSDQSKAGGAVGLVREQMARGVE